MRVHVWRVPVRGTDAYVAGWKGLAATPMVRFVVPWVVGISYPVLYFGTVRGMRGTVVEDWLTSTTSGWVVAITAFLLVWVWLGFSPGIAQRALVRRVLRRRARGVRCLVCGYALAGVLVDAEGGRRCPECGTEHGAGDFDDEDQRDASSSSTGAKR